MKALFLMCAASMLGLSLHVRAGTEAMETAAVVKKGQDVVVNISYKGREKNWDGSIGYSRGEIVVLNNAFLKVTDSKGVELKPADDHFITLYRNVVYNEAFSSQVNLSSAYALDKPGEYLVTWGCNDNSQSIRVLIIQ
jgi:hypothetical protein